MKLPRPNKSTLFFLFCFFIFSVAVAALAFSIAVRGAEQVLVPDVTGKDVVEALLELQEKELYPRVQLRVSANNKYQVLEQDPAPGAIVKAGRRIRLVISQGGKA